MVDRLVCDTLNAPDAGRKKRRFSRQMDRNLGEIAAQLVLDRQVSDDRYGVLVERDVDVIRSGRGNFYSSGHRCLMLRPLEHALRQRKKCTAAVECRKKSRSENRSCCSAYTWRACAHQERLYVAGSDREPHRVFGPPGCCPREHIGCAGEEIAISRSSSLYFRPNPLALKCPYSLV